MTNNSCSICGNNTPDHDDFLFVHSNKYQLKRCIKCGNTYTYVPDDINTDLYYDSGDYTIRDTRNSIFFKIQKNEYNSVIKKIKAILNKEDISLLDFGSGKGLFMHFASLKRIKVKGIETSLPRAQFSIENYNFDINTDFYKAGKVFREHFDIITCFHVLEHIQRPDCLLSNLASDNLKENGLLVAEVPQIDSWQSRWSGKYWLHLDTPRHVNHFTKEGFRELLQLAGFHIIRTETFSLHLGIIGMTQTILSWLGYRSFLLGQLKERKKISLTLAVLLVLPLAIILEFTAGICGRGGIIRYYAIKRPVT